MAPYQQRRWGACAPGASFVFVRNRLGKPKRKEWYYGNLLRKTENPCRSSSAAGYLTDDVMQERLPRDVYKSLRKTIDEGKDLDLGVANAVASA